MDDEKRPDPNDDSKVEGAIGVVKGRVEIHYPQPRSRVVFDADNARQFGEMMAKAAYEARYGVKPTEGSSRLAEGLRVRMVTRGTHMIRSMLKDGKSDQEIVTALVDVIMSELA